MRKVRGGSAKDNCLSQVRALSSENVLLIQYVKIEQTLIVILIANEGCKAIKTELIMMISK